MSIRTLGEVLQNPERLTWGEWVLFQPERPLSATTPCRIENLDGLPPNVDHPPEAVAAGFSTSLDTAIVQDIVDSLLDQVPDADVNLRLRAFE